MHCRSHYLCENKLFILPAARHVSWCEITNRVREKIKQPRQQHVNLLAYSQWSITALIILFIEHCKYTVLSSYIGYLLYYWQDNNLFNSDSYKLLLNKLCVHFFKFEVVTYRWRESIKTYESSRYWLWFETLLGVFEIVDVILRAPFSYFLTLAETRTRF